MRRSAPRFAAHRAPFRAAFAALSCGAFAACGASGHGAAADHGDASVDAAASDAAVAADVVYERLGYDSAGPAPVARVPVAAEVVSSRVDAQQLLFAGGEMQISGEPFAQLFAGRNLADYDRNYIPPDQYILDNGTPDATPVTDLFGFSTAVESYEYSKYIMNMVVQETGAGVSLAAAPLVGAQPGAALVDKLRGRMGALLSNAGTDVAGLATLPAPTNNPLNLLGFPGQWPSYLPFRSWDPTMYPTLAIVPSCTFQGGYVGVGFGATIDPVYECDYNSTRLHDREQQVEKVVVPAAVGYAAWKEALWAIDFAGRIHDTCNAQVNSVAPSDMATIGQHGNTVVATSPSTACVGTYIGSSPLEGMWGLTMLEAMDNASEWLIASDVTRDGKTLQGFASTSAALAYDYGSPLAWFPAAVNVTEDGATPFPAVTAQVIADGTSRSVDLSALLLGHSMFFGMTDARNAGVGQRIGLMSTFDGDPFPADDGIADGQDTAHDRSLAVLRVALIDLDRIHADPALGILMDGASVAGGVVTRSSTVSTTALAHALIALRQLVLSLNGSITQYGAPDPNPDADLGGILNQLPFHPPGPIDAGVSVNFSRHARDMFLTNAAFVRDVLTRADGSVANSASVSGGQATASSDPTTIESQAAAVRALTEAFLMTGDASFQVRARAVSTALESMFYSPPARLYRQQANGPDQVHMTPERFAWLQSALRETYKSLSVAGDAVLDRTVLEDRVARVNKLYLNGWDDLDGNKAVDQPAECLAGRLQMGEQALTGELGRDGLGRPTSDRDGDCVIELAHAQQASVQASDVFFHVANDAGP